MKILFVWPNRGDPFFKPISISLLSALLKRDGHETACFDTSFINLESSAYVSESLTEAHIFKPIDWAGYDLEKKDIDAKKDFLEKLESFQPDVLAVTVLSDEIEVGEMLSEEAKKWNKDISVIWGGKGAMVDIEKVLSFTSVDFVCIGEGITVMPDFVNALSKNEPVEGLDNIYYKKDNKIVKNKLRSLFCDLDELPHLDWSIFDERLFYKPYDGKVYRSGDHMIAWGCPNNCTYCINDYYHNLYCGFKMQRYSPKRIVTELKELTDKYDLGFYKFHDEDFLMKPTEYFEELVDLYSEKVGAPFVCMTNSKTATPERVKLLKEMGCVSVSIGIETGNSGLRKDMLNRKDTVDEIVNAFKLFKEAGIKANAFNMLGLPFETRETYMDTVNLNRKANVQVPQIDFFYPFKGTKLRDIAIENGFYDPKNEKKYISGQPALHFKNLSEEELIIMHKRFVLYVKLPGRFWPFIKRSEKVDETGKALEKKLYELYDKCVAQNDNWFECNGKEEAYISELNELAGEE